jgi:solute carrier family 15 oligopeptide transporter 1
MRNILNFSEDKATVLYHTFLMLCYFTPIPGAIVADTYLGKFKLASILYIAIANTLINWLNLQNNRNPIVRVRLRKRLARRCGYSKFPSANVSDHLFSLITNFKLKLFFCLISGFSMTGLLIIAIGTGGIKPCVSAFGGDQFVRPQQDRQLESFFSVFYFSVNAGSLISTAVTPILREDVSCFGDDTCYPLAFGVPAVLMLISVGKVFTLKK